MAELPVLVADRARRAGALIATGRRPLLKLYVAGGTARARAAVSNVRRVCEEILGGEYRLVVIDVLEQPHLAERDRVVVTPTLVRASPLPGLRVLGDFSNTDTLRTELRLLA